MTSNESGDEDLIIPFGSEANVGQIMCHSGSQQQNGNEIEREENGGNILANRTQFTIYTLALFYSFIDVGVCSSIFNPTLVELSHIFETSLESISFIFPIRAIGCTLGTLTNGLLNNYFDRQMLLIVFLILKALTTFLVPHWRRIDQFYTNAFFNGFFTAAIVVMVNVWLNEMWASLTRKRLAQITTGPEVNGRKPIDLANVFMQGLHFFYGCGTIFGPLLAEPFLTNSFQDLNYQFVSNNLVLPYLIASILPLSSSLIFFWLYLSTPYLGARNEKQMESESESNLNLLAQSNSSLTATTTTTPTTANHNDDDNDNVNDNNQMEQAANGNQGWSYLVILSCALFLAIFAFSEGTYFQFSSTFCSKTKLNLSQAQSALIASTLAISFTVFRGLSVLIAMRLSPATMIILDLLTIAFGNSIVYLFADSNLILLTTGFILLGAGFSSIFPSLFPFLEQNGYMVTDWIGSLITFSSGVAQVLAPFIIGLYIDQNPFVLVALTFVSITGSIIVFFIMRLLMKINDNVSNGRARE